MVYTAQELIELIIKKIKRINRKNLPDEEKIPENKKMDRDQMVCFSSNDICFTKWMDHKGVHMLSDFLGIHPIEQLQRKSKGEKEKFAVRRPSVIHEYNKLMGGVDLMDQKKLRINLTIG